MIGIRTDDVRSTVPVGNSERVENFDLAALDCCLDVFGEDAPVIRAAARHEYGTRAATAARRDSANATAIATAFTSLASGQSRRA